MSLFDFIPRVIMFCFSLCVLFIVFNGSYSGLLDPSHRCGISDAECQKNFFQFVGSNYAKKGIPEIGVPILDPYRLRNVTVSFKDVITVTLEDGDASGIADCIVTRYETDIVTKMKISQFTCDTITIRGHYKLMTGPFLRLTVGNFIDSEGYISVTFEHWHINTTYPFEVEKNEKGDIYIRCLFDEAHYDQSFGNIIIHVANITSGNENTSESVVNFTNANWKSLISSFGRYFGDKAIGFYYNVHDKFFNTVPAKYYITDDLSPYVKNDDDDDDDDDDDYDE